VRYIIAVAISVLVSTVNADDTATKGKALHNQHCLACHKPELYTKPNPRVASRKKLSTQVQLCEQQLQLRWFDEETESVAEYLNTEYYHFK